MKFEVFQNTTNLVGGAFVTVATYLFGGFWYLFVGLMVLNVVDFATGSYKARVFHTESSKIGAMGIVKKVYYWVVIFIAFFLSFAFTELGSFVGMKLDFSVFIGYFTLASYIINEIRSILENIVVIDSKNPVPSFLTKGLEVVSKKLMNST